MGQMGVSGVSKRYEGLDAKAAPAGEGLAASAEGRTSKAGRKPWDVVVIFKAIMPCELYTLSDEQMEEGKAVEKGL